MAKTRIAAVKQLERIRKGLEKRCSLNRCGNLVTPNEIKTRYESACNAFVRMFGELPTLRETALVCYPTSMFVKKLN